MPPRLDLSAFGGSDSEGEDFPPKRQLELTALKTKTFSHGITKKTKKDLEKEAEDKKRLEEEEALARVNAEYEAAFDGPSVGHAPLGGTRGGGWGRPIGPGGGFVRAGGAPLVPFQPPRGPAAGFQAPPTGPSGGFQPPRGPAAMGYARAAPPRAPSPPPSTTGPQRKGKRAMDSFLEEIKGNQSAREQRLGNLAKQEGSSVSALAAWETEKGNRAVGDQETTNLFVSNLPSNITEESLGLFFAKLGPVGTVKIMWPRGDEDTSIGAGMTVTRRHKPGLSGFVSYMKRDGAERAVREYDGMDWGGSVLRVGWSKPVPMPLRALYDLGNGRDKRDRSPPPRRGRRGSYSSDSSNSRSPPPKKLSARERWLATVPDEQYKFIKTVATRVKDHGKGFEDLLRNKERDNPKFGFLVNAELPDYHLYQSCLDSRYRIPTPPPDDFGDEGYASLYSSDSAEDSERERVTRGKLGKIARKRFEAMLRAMSGRRAEIARGMEFALKRAEAADEVAEVVCQSLKLDATPVPRKMARLHLISDILHNSASPLPNVWKYRQAFESRLPPVFAHLSTVYQSLLAYSGKISADVFKGQVAAVLEIWERWIVFNSESAEYLRGLLDGTKALATTAEKAAAAKVQEARREESQARASEEESKFKTSGFKSSFKPISASVPAPVASAPISQLQATAAMGADADVDGEPKDDDLDGEAMDMDEDLDGEEMEDLDGEEMV
ncbi:hypothetical protein IAU60_006223 [Kwoniella sp. DSM 27419]